MNTANSILSFFRYLGLGSLIAIGVLSEVPGELRPHIFAVSQLEHVVAYFAAALLLALGFWNRRNVLLLSLALPLYAAVLEIAQMFIPGRNSEFIDFFASSVVTHGVIVNSTGSDGALLSDADYSINAPQNGVRERREGDPLSFTIRS